MVKFQTQLDGTFGALSHPTRRAILALLERESSVSVSALAQTLDVKLPAMMKHLDVLSDARLIRRSKRGRTVTVELSPRPLREAVDWLERYKRFWSASLDRLTAYAEAKESQVRARGKWRL
jgi:DNA-binding transcriptional ArsR family regulator